MLVAALVHAGAEYWSDEYPVLDVDGLAHPIQAFVGWLPSSIYWSSLARKGFMVLFSHPSLQSCSLFVPLKHGYSGLRQFSLAFH
jgi:hypothetical protein